MAETLYEMYCRVAEASGDEPSGSDDLADAWVQYEFDPASERLAEEVKKRWQIKLHPSAGSALDTLTDDMLEYLHEQGSSYWTDVKQTSSDRWNGTATLFVGWVEDRRFFEDVYLLVPDEELIDIPGGDHVVAITEEKLKEAPYAEGLAGR
jgi:hypothetical protein